MPTIIYLLFLRKVAWFRKFCNIQYTFTCTRTQLFGARDDRMSYIQKLINLLNLQSMKTSKSHNKKLVEKYKCSWLIYNLTTFETSVT